MSEAPPRERLHVLQTDEGTLSVDVVRSGDVAVADLPLPGRPGLVLEATGVRTTTSGVHACLRILTCDDRFLLEQVCNVQRDEDRTRLGRSVSKRLTGSYELSDAIKARLDLACANLWEAWTAADEAWWVQPDYESAGPAWVLEPYVVEAGGTILFGPPGAGKSWMGLLWALSVSHGSGPWGVPESRQALFVNLERSKGSVAWRVARVAEALGVGRPRLLTLNARGRSLADVLTGIRRTISAHDVGFVVVDSLSRAGAGDLNANDAANIGMDMLNSTGVAWCALAHSPKANSDTIFGSVMYEAAADVTVKLSSQIADESDDRMGLQLQVRKANDIRKAPPRTWALSFDAKGLSSIAPADSGEFPDLVAPTLSTGQQVHSYLSSVGSASTSQISDELDLNRSRVAHVLTESGRFVCIEQGKGRKPSLWGIRSRQEGP